MATYKKNNNRPNRQKDTEHLDEAKQAQLHKESTTAEVFDALDAGATRTEDWVKRNQKIIIGTLIAVAVIGLGYLLYQQFVKAPREKNAANELFFAQQFFDEAMELMLERRIPSLKWLSTVEKENMDLSKLPKTTAVPKLLTSLNTVWVWLICVCVTITTQ